MHQHAGSLALRISHGANEVITVKVSVYPDPCLLPYDLEKSKLPDEFPGGLEAKTRPRLLLGSIMSQESYFVQDLVFAFKVCPYFAVDSDLSQWYKRVPSIQRIGYELSIMQLSRGAAFDASNFERDGHYKISWELYEGVD